VSTSPAQSASLYPDNSGSSSSAESFKPYFKVSLSYSITPIQRCLLGIDMCWDRNPTAAEI